jgi:hypothetical protein
MKTGHAIRRKCLVLRQHDKNKPDPAHMLFLRKLVGFSRKDHIKQIRKWLGAASIAEEIQSYQTHWTAHVDRMKDSHVAEETVGL